MIAKDGYRIILYTGVILVVLVTLGICNNSLVLGILSGLVGVIFIFHFFFFRNPERTIPQGDTLILSPADGKIIGIDEVEEPNYIKGKALRVCIFMSVFNVHINRNPVAGKIEMVEHKDGQFLAAFADHAPDVNERTLIGVNSSFGKVFFMQIAGLIARRIVCNLKTGDDVIAGDRFGMIKYSSRVDLFLPLDVKLNVKLKDSVKAGISIIGEFNK